MRETRTRKSSVNDLKQRVMTEIRKVVGKYWRNYVTVESDTAQQTIALTIKPSLRGSLLSSLNEALQKMAARFRGVEYCPRSYVVSIA